MYRPKKISNFWQNYSIFKKHTVFLSQENQHSSERAQKFELDGPATSYGCYDGYETEIRVFQSRVVVLQPPDDKIRNLLTKPTCKGDEVKFDYNLRLK